MRARADDAELLLTAKNKLLRTARSPDTCTSSASQLNPCRRCRTRGAGFPGPKPAPESSCFRRSKTGPACGRHEPVRAQCSPSASSSQDLDITAPIIDFFVADGRRSTARKLPGPRRSQSLQPRILIPQARNPRSAPSSPPAVLMQNLRRPRTPKPLTSVHGAPDAKNRQPRPRPARPCEHQSNP